LSNKYYKKMKKYNIYFEINFLESIAFCQILVYNTVMNKDFSQMPIDVLNNKIRVVLSSIGMSESYIGFSYIMHIISYMIRNNDDSTSTYHQAIEYIKDRYHITSRSVSYGVNGMLKNCHSEKIMNLSQYNLTNNSNLNKIRVLKNYIISLM